MQTKRSNAPQPPRQLPAWQLFLIDLALVGICLLVFALFDHVIQVRKQAVPVMQSAAEPAPAAPQTVAVDQAQPEATVAPAVGDFSQKFADKFTDGEIIQTEDSYRSANLNVTLTRHEFDVEGYHEVMFVQDIYIRNIECLRTVFAKDNFGKAITEDFMSMSDRAVAVAAVNADFYSHNSLGVVIRNGVMYRDTWAPDLQVLVIFRDGTMKVYRTEAEFNTKEVMDAGAWQAFTFGPGLLDGNGNLLPEGYESTNHNPRTIIGMVEPGHYMFIVIDGRQGGYSDGMTYKGSARICQELGCQMAFNLDGGKTSQMSFQGHVANHPYSGGRDTSDIVYVAEP